MFTVSRVFQTNPAKSYSLSKLSHFWQQFFKMGTRHVPPHPSSLTLFPYKKIHYLCKWPVNVQLPNCASTYIVSTSFLPAVMPMQFWNWVFKVKLLHSHFWPLKVWLCTRKWSICKNTFKQHLDTQQSKFYRKIYDYSWFLKLEGPGKILILHAFHYEDLDTNLVWHFMDNLCILTLISKILLENKQYLRI